MIKEKARYYAGLFLLTLLISKLHQVDIFGLHQLLDGFDLGFNRYDIGKIKGVVLRTRCFDDKIARPDI